jgi:hypothetical protein
MPLLRAGQVLKRWRYVGVYGPELMLCLGCVRVGPVPQTFWAVWDRRSRRLRERTCLGRGRVRLDAGRARLEDRGVAVDLLLEESPGVEVVCPDGSAYVWTRKQAGIPARGHVTIDGDRLDLDGLAVVDDTAGYHSRRTAWSWSAGVGSAADGTPLAWNLVAGVNDPPRDSERAVWLGREASEVGAVDFSPALDRIDFGEGGCLRFESEAVRERRDNLLLVRSSYRQPFGTFSGELPGGIPVAEGFGVMEHHEAVW